MNTELPDPMDLADTLDRIVPFSLRRDLEPILQASTLLRKQNADIYRKDALLKQALEAINLHQSAHPETYRQARDAITKELQT